MYMGAYNTPPLDARPPGYWGGAAEVDHQDKWQRAALGMAAVAATPGHVTEVLDAVERFVWSFPEVEVVDTERVWADA
jgi:uncharacterized protein YlxP (DUF503 family)